MDANTYIFIFMLMFDTLLHYGSPIRSALFVKFDFNGLGTLPVGLYNALEKYVDIDCLLECLRQPECRSFTLFYDDVTPECGLANDVMNGSFVDQCLCMEFVSLRWVSFSRNSVSHVIPMWFLDEHHPHKRRFRSSYPLGWLTIIDQRRRRVHICVLI